MWQPGFETGIWNWRGSLEELKSCRMWCYLQVDSVNIEMDWVELNSENSTQFNRIACAWCGRTDRHIGIGPTIIYIHFLVLNLETQCRFTLQHFMWPLPTPSLITVFKPFNCHMWVLATITHGCSRTCIQGVEVLGPHVRTSSACCKKLFSSQMCGPTYISTTTAPHFPSSWCFERL